MNNEETKIQDAEVEKNDAQEEIREGKKKKVKFDWYVELALFLILGFLIGIAVKTEAYKRVTIGFDDYKMNIFQVGYDVNRLEIEAMKKRNEQAESGNVNLENQDATQGGSCAN